MNIVLLTILHFSVYLNLRRPFALMRVVPSASMHVKVTYAQFLLPCELHSALRSGAVTSITFDVVKLGHIPSRIVLPSIDVNLTEIALLRNPLPRIVMTVPPLTMPNLGFRDDNFMSSITVLAVLVCVKRKYIERKNDRINNKVS